MGNIGTVFIAFDIQVAIGAVCCLRQINSDVVAHNGNDGGVGVAYLHCVQRGIFCKRCDRSDIFAAGLRKIRLAATDARVEKRKGRVVISCLYRIHARSHLADLTNDKCVGIPQLVQNRQRAVTNLINGNGIVISNAVDIILTTGPNLCSKNSIAQTSHIDGRYGT